MTFDLTKFAQNLADHLPGWSYVPDHDLQSLGYRRLRHTDGGSVSLYYDNRADKIEVGPNWIRDRETVYPKDYGPPETVAHRPDSIRVSPNRPIDQLARDIQKRLLTDYLAAYGIGKAQKAVDDDYAARKQALLDRIAVLLNRDPAEYNDREEIRTYLFPADAEHTPDNGIRVEIRVISPDQVHLHLKDLSPELAVRLLSQFEPLPPDKRTP